MNWMVNIESQKMSSHLCFDLTPISGRHSYLFVLCPIFLGDHIKHCDHKIKGSWYSAFGKMWSIRGIVVVVVVAIVVLILLLEIIIITTMMIIMKSWDSGLTKLFLCFKQPLDFPIPPEFLSSQWLNHWLLAEVGNSQWVSTFVKVRAENLRGLKEHGEKPSDGNRKMGRCGITMVNHWIGIAYFWTDPHVNW